MRSVRQLDESQSQEQAEETDLDRKHTQAPRHKRDALCVLFLCVVS